MIPPPPDPGSVSPPSSLVTDFLDRPRQQRELESRYRFGQAVVFGLPVWALQLFGRSLGGPEADRWVGILQALLAGWVVYVAAAGMLFEGIVRLGQRKLATDLPVAVAAIGLYGWGVVSAARLISHRTGQSPALPFHWCVLLLAAWSFLRWWRMKMLGRQNRPSNSQSSESRPEVLR